ncbi:MAG TPA: adenylate/guanylate cyclase domain-containing protein [Opitutaceae bacterium]|nr:adenylate/guanylate cyclase domain-containing protein [Opitutaceae bacterium]
MSAPPPALRPLTTPPFPPPPPDRWAPFRFRHFRTRLLLLLLALVGVAQLAAFLVVAEVHEADARREINHDLDIAARQFAKEIERGNGYLARTAEALSGDYAFKQTFARTQDAATLRSALESFKLRARPDLVACLSLDGAVLAETRDGPSAAAYYRPLVTAADNSDSLSATSYGLIDGALYSLTAVPIRAPDVVAWIIVGIRLDQRFIEGLKATSGVEITLRHAGRTLASTVQAPARFNSVVQRLALADGDAAEIVLQFSLDEKLAPARRLERVLEMVGGGSLALAALLSLALARSVSRPVQALAAHTDHVVRGDYMQRIELHSADEFGRLAAAFNRMTAGLADRDRVRELLGKVVSPEIAAQLLRSEAVLGGEEREVTILFSDLRNFTGLSESLVPAQVLALLNRYLDRMSTIVEEHHGVVDKYIGDAIMALFGAPVDDPAAADHALAAALAMNAALGTLNNELAAEGQPQLAVGIGINTAPVVAGNMGSRRRLNYTVIGDGVNVAARLQALTKEPGYQARILISESTLRAARDQYATRALGEVAVRGRAGMVRLFALDAKAASASSRS